MARQRLLKIVEIGERRKARRRAQRAAFGHRLLRLAAIALGVVSVAAALLAAAAFPFYAYVTHGLPPAARLEQLMDPNSGELLQPTRFYDRTGQQLLLSLEPQGSPRSFVVNGNRDLLDAFLSSQDPDFWARPGNSLLDFDSGPIGLAEELVARLLLPDDADGWMKTLRARLLATEVEARYGRAQILTWALNSTYFGHWAFGIESASQLYFGKSSVSLSLAESALLAAVAEAPALNPIDAPELAIEYQRLVLSAMRDQRLITDKEFSSAFGEQLVFSSESSAPVSEASEFTDLALEQLEQELGLQRIQLGGMKVITTMDYSLQQEASALLAGGGLEAAVLDPMNGQILALVGAMTSHPAERMLTPFAYLQLFAQGQAPASLLWTRHGPTTLRAALAAAELLPAQDDVPLSSRVAELFGITGAGSNESLGEWSVLNAAMAYGPLANRGLLVGREFDGSIRPTAVLFAGDAQDGVLLNWITPSLQVFTSPELAALVTDVLADGSVRPATAPAPAGLGRPFAFLQTLEQDSQAWQVGYSPQRVVVLWAQSADALGELLTGLFEAAHRGLLVKNWELPSGLTNVIVCVPSGQLPDDDCPQTRREWFLAGSEPTEFDSLYQRIAINTLNGNLATVFTPEEFIEERVFLMVPASARSWARAAGVELPPEDYDAVPYFAGQGSGVSILEPGPFTEVNGTVEITGLFGAGVITYDVQVGQGLRAEEWLMVAEGEVDAGNQVTVEWDTSGLSGLWSIQLQASDGEGNLVRAYSAVTITN
ncbi:MAG: transglycosylase domain-containing protein [Anaerolineales bacterium]